MQEPALREQLVRAISPATESSRSSFLPSLYLFLLFYPLFVVVGSGGESTYRQVSNVTADGGDRCGAGGGPLLVEWEASPARAARTHGRMCQLLLGRRRRRGGSPCCSGLVASVFARRQQRSLTRRRRGSRTGRSLHRLRLPVERILQLDEFSIL